MIYCYCIIYFLVFGTWTGFGFFSTSLKKLKLSSFNAGNEEIEAEERAEVIAEEEEEDEVEKEEEEEVEIGAVFCVSREVFTVFIIPGIR